MQKQKPLHAITCTMMLIVHLLSACTLKLTTDLSKIIGVDNPKQLMASSEAQQIATKIGEGMGTKIMEGEILAEDMGKGLGEVFLKPEELAVITDPISRDLIEKSGSTDIRSGRLPEAIDSFKRTNNLARLEEIALILFDRGNARDAADVHQYLINQGWPIRPAYLVAHRVEQQGLATISTPHLKEIDPQQYNATYTRGGHGILDTAVLNEDFVSHNIISKEDMINRLKAAPVIILADAYFDTRQHALFLEILQDLYQPNLVIGLEREVHELKENKKAADALRYQPLFAFMGERGAATFSHGPLQGDAPVDSPGSIDFFHWDSTLAATVSDLLSRKKQLLLISGNTHAAPGHLPFLIEMRSGINPVVVVQNLLNVNANHWFEKQETLRKRFAAWGAADGSVITVENDLYLNSSLSSEDFKHYLDLFALEPFPAAP